MTRTRAEPVAAADRRVTAIFKSIAAWVRLLGSYRSLGRVCGCAAAGGIPLAMGALDALRAIDAALGGDAGSAS